MAFGQPQRSATQDANEGAINPPAKKHTARQVSAKQVLIDEQPGLESFAQSMGSAIQQRLEEEAEYINQRRANQAAIRQGTKHAINTVDATKKRTGWERAIFGDNVEYRAAQQRAAQNAVQDTYIQQAAELDKFAGESPEQYEKRLQAGLEETLKKYEGDAETQELVAKSYHTASAKLAAKHYESHYAYNQQQQRETYYNQVLGGFDTWEVDKGKISSAEEARGFQQGITNFFNGATKPQGMSGIAWRGTINEALSTSLRNGNIGAYNAAKGNGWLDKLNDKELKSLNQAVSAYDTKFANNVALTFENAELAALEANDLEVAAGIYDNLITELDNLATRSSGTDRAELALARGKTGAQKGINAARKEAEKVAKAAYDTAVENMQAQDRIDSIKAALREKDPVTKSGQLTEISPKPKELEEVLDLTIVEDVSRMLGAEYNVSTSEAVKAIMEKPEIAATISARLRGEQTNAPIVKRTAETFLNGFHGMINEDGQLNEQGVVAMQSLSQFAKNSDTFKSMIGNTNFDKYEIIRRGMSAGQTVDMINKHIDRYTQNVGNKGDYAIQWELNENESRRDRVAQLYNNMTGAYPNSSSLAYALKEMNRGLVIYEGDMDLAENYLKVSLQTASLTYKGKTIVGGKDLNKVTQYNFEQLMDAATAKIGNTSLFTPVLLAGGYELDDDNQFIDLEDDVSFYKVDGTDGFFVDHPKFNQAIQVSSSTMKRWADEVEQRDLFKKMEEKNKRESFNKWFRNQAWLGNSTR